MGLDFGTYEDVVFERAPLSTVLCQVRFPPVLSLLAQAGLTGFQASLRNSYPVMLPAERTASVEMGLDRVEMQATPPVWRFMDSERVWTVGLAVDFVSLESAKYTHVGEFLARFDAILHALRATVRPAESLRVGLRKVNSIPLPDPTSTTSLLGIVRQEMLGPLAVAAFPAPIITSSNQLQFTEDYAFLNVRYGLQSGDGVTKFILDLDHFTERPFQVGDNPNLAGQLRYFSDSMTSFFHWAIEDDFKQTLGPRSREEGGLL